MVLTTSQPDVALINSDVTDLQETLVVVGIPAYNEEKTIARVVLEAKKYADIVVVCDDGSADMTKQIAERMGADVVRHEQNSGYGAAIQTLFKRAKELRANVLVTLDGDGQHDPEEIQQLIKPILTGNAEVVLGSRFMNECGTADMPFYRKIGIKVVTKLANGSGKNRVTDSQSGFRAYGKQAIESLSMSENGMSASVEILRAIGKSGLKICEVPISCKYADSVGVETSTENPVTHGVGLIMSIVKLVVEDKPLMLLGLPGIASLIMGALLGVWLMNLYVDLGRIVTNVALASIGFLILGCFMLSTAITLYGLKRLSQRIEKKA